MDHNFRKWYLYSFLVTLALFAVGFAVFSPRLGLALEGNTNVDEGQILSLEPDALEVPLLTDHPEGRTFGTVVDHPVGIDNRQEPVSTRAEEPQPPHSNAAGESMTGALGVDMLDATDEAAHIASVDAAGVLVIPSADFRSDGFDPDGFFFSFSGGHLNGGATNPCVMAPVYLPDGVIISGFYASVRDADASELIWLQLYRLDNYTGAVSEVAYVATTDVYSDTSIVTVGDITINTPVVSYPNYSYYVGGCLGSPNIALYSVRIYH